MTVTVGRLGSTPAAITNGTATYYTVPAATTAIITNIRIVNPGASKRTIKIGIGGVTDALLVEPPVPAPIGGKIEIPTWIPMVAGETLQVNATGTGCTLVLSGFTIT